MDPDYLQHQLELWKRWLYVCIGASVTFLATTIADIPNFDSNATSFYHVEASVGGMGYFPGWFGVWLLLQVAITPLGFLLLFAKGWQGLPISTRLKTAYGFLLTAWVAFLAFGIRATGFDAPELLGYLVFLLGIVLSVSYLWLKRAYLTPSEELFP